MRSSPEKVAICYLRQVPERGPSTRQQQASRRVERRASDPEGSRGGGEFRKSTTIDMGEREDWSQSF